jgi:hypothetical protein
MNGVAITTGSSGKSWPTIPTYGYNDELAGTGISSIAYFAGMNGSGTPFGSFTLIDGFMNEDACWIEVETNINVKKKFYMTFPTITASGSYTSLQNATDTSRAMFGYRWS